MLLQYGNTFVSLLHVCCVGVCVCECIMCVLCIGQQLWPACLPAWVPSSLYEMQFPRG